MASLLDRLRCTYCARFENEIRLASAAQFRAQANDAELFLADPLLDLVRPANALWTTDPAQAVKAWTPLAEAGSILSMIRLGHAFREGRGTPKDEAKAELWFRRAFEAGSDTGGVFLGCLCVSAGRFEEAREIFAVGVARNLAQAQWRLAFILLRKPTSAEDLAKARRLLERAAAQGYLSAAASLSYFLMHGRFGLRERFKGVRLGLRLLDAIPAKERYLKRTDASPDNRDGVDDPSIARLRHV